MDPPALHLPEPGPPDSEGSVGDVQNAHVDEPRAD